MNCANNNNKYVSNAFRTRCLSTRRYRREFFQIFFNIVDRKKICQRNSVPFVTGYTATTRCILRRFCALRVYKNNVTISFFSSFFCARVFFHIPFFPPLFFFFPFLFFSFLSSRRNDKKHRDSTTVDSTPSLKIFPPSNSFNRIIPSNCFAYCCFFVNRR